MSPADIIDACALDQLCCGAEFEQMPQTARPVRLRRPASRPAPARNQAARCAYRSRRPVTERNRVTDLPMRLDSARLCAFVLSLVR